MHRLPTHLPSRQSIRLGPMGDAPVGKVNSSRVADETPPAPESNVLNPIKPGESPDMRMSGSDGRLVLNQISLTCWFHIIATTSVSRPAPGTHHSSPTGLSSSGRHGPPFSLDMTNMSYALPDHHSQSSSFEIHHMVPHYPAPSHTSGVVYPMQPVGQYHGHDSGAGVPFGTSFAPSYLPYTLPQQGHHVGSHYPTFAAGPSISGMGFGHAPAFGAGYYPHPPFATPYTNTAHPMSGQPQGMVHIRQGPRASTAKPSSSNRDDKRAAGAEYDVSKTIVDGSNPMRLAQPSLTSGKLTSSIASAHEFTCPLVSRCNPCRPTYIDHSEHTPRAAAQAKAIWSRTLGWESTAGGKGDEPSRPFLAGCNQGY